MAGTPQWKIYDADRNYVAATVDSTLAAALVGSAGSDGWTVKVDGRIVWVEGETFVPAYERVLLASESYDTVAEYMDGRRWDNTQAARDRVMGAPR